MNTDKLVKLGRVMPDGSPLQVSKSLESAPGLGGALIQHGFAFLSSPSAAVRIGVWDSTPQIHKQAPYSVDEAMLIIAGSVTMVDAAGKLHTFREGELFIVPKGLPCAWHQPEFVQKFYCIRSYSAEVEATPHAIVSIPPIVTDEAQQASEKQAGLKLRSLYGDVDRGMYAGTMEACVIGEFDVEHGFYELIYVDRGRIEISHDGLRVRLNPGEAAAIPTCDTVHLRVIEPFHARYVRAIG